MKGINIEDINNMNEKELDNTIDYLIQVKKDRKKYEKDVAILKLHEAWDAVVKLGVDIYDYEGNPIKNFEELEFYY